VDPRDAAIRSLIFPGLGHRALGRGLDGLARGVLFVVTFGLGVLLAIAASGSGALVAAWALFLVAGTKVLMWALVGVVFVGVGLLVFGVVTATHR